ncbi:MAG: Fe-Mn family superoxide dismutase [Patescibacteria group bacterium]
MKKFEELKFDIGALKGISKKTIEEHLKLYAGYVKHSNLILDHIIELSKDSEKNAYELGEIQRRFAFEFDGMRNHEYYFKSLEGGVKIMKEESPLKKAIKEEWGSVDLWFARFKTIALTRGIGWAVLYYDPIDKKMINAWIDEQHLGHLTGLQWIFGIDMWEHSFYLDYATDKKKYIDAFLDNVNWEVVEENFKKAQ